MQTQIVKGLPSYLLAKHTYKCSEIVAFPTGGMAQPDVIFKVVSVQHQRSNAVLRIIVLEDNFVIRVGVQTTAS